MNYDHVCMLNCRFTALPVLFYSALPNELITTWEARRMEHVIGIDTGGTFTDAVIVDPHARRVIAAAKALTTRGDLAIGVNEALSRVLAEAGVDFKRESVVRVCLSTTLATNALVEGHGCNVCAILIGFDESMASRTQITQAIPGTPVLHVAGGHTYSGDEATPLDEAALRNAVSSVDAEAFSVTANYASRNPEHELRAKKIIQALRDCPVTASSELTDALNGPRRALTATLNARIIGLIVALEEAVCRAMHALGLNVPIMIVKGDGAISDAATVLERPIQTILSGPAASVIGARFLSGKTDFVISDIGGTTTDVAIVRNGWPALDEKGAKVGDLRTLVHAIDMSTMGLGGDSEVAISATGEILLGNRRVIPISLLAARHPQVRDRLRVCLTDPSAMRNATQYLQRPQGFEMAKDARLSELDRRFLENLPDEKPRPYSELMYTAANRGQVARLIRRGYLQLSGFTPSDAAHVLGRQSHWDVETARLACEFVGRSAGHISGDINVGQQVERFAEAVSDAVATSSTQLLLEKLLGFESSPENSLLDSAAAGKEVHGHIRLRFESTLPLVAVGGPAPAFYSEVARRLGVSVEIPEHHAVANAVGAAVGLIRTQVLVEITYREGGGFILHGEGEPRVVMDPDDALAEAEQEARARALKEAEAMGASGIRCDTDIARIDMPYLPREQSLMSAMVTAECIGVASLE